MTIFRQGVRIASSPSIAEASIVGHILQRDYEPLSTTTFEFRNRQHKLVPFITTATRRLSIRLECDIT